MKRAVPTNSDVAKRRRTLRNVSANGTVPEAVFANILMGLRVAGYLDGSIIGSSSSKDTAQQRTVRAHVQQAIEEHAHAKTPYGPVVQWLPLICICSVAPMFVNMVHTFLRNHHSIS